jgi:hypothetical protein
MISRLLCWWKGHRRGKFLRAEDNGRTKVFACPRCKREKRYEVKAA